MAKKKQFSPHIYQEWGELFENLSDKQNAEILKAITKYPNFEPENNPIWKFIKSQIEKDYEIFIDKCNKNETIIRNYWQRKKSNDNECILDDNKRIRTNTNEYECLPKRITNNEITNNELRITETETETINEITETETGKIDIYADTIINKVFEIYKSHCTELVKLDRFYSRNIELKKMIGSYLEQTESDLEYFTRVCDIANRVKKIGSVNVDLKTILRNHDGFYNGKYQEEQQEERTSPYTYVR